MQPGSYDFITYITTHIEVINRGMERGREGDDVFQLLRRSIPPAPENLAEMQFLRTAAQNGTLESAIEDIYLKLMDDLTNYQGELKPEVKAALSQISVLSGNGVIKNWSDPAIIKQVIESAAAPLLNQVAPLRGSYNFVNDFFAKKDFFLKKSERELYLANKELFRAKSRYAEKLFLEEFPEDPAMSCISLNKPTRDLRHADLLTELEGRNVKSKTFDKFKAVCELYDMTQVAKDDDPDRNREIFLAKKKEHKEALVVLRDSFVITACKYAATFLLSLAIIIPPKIALRFIENMWVSKGQKLSDSLDTIFHRPLPVKEKTSAVSARQRAKPMDQA